MNGEDLYYGLLVGFDHLMAKLRDVGHAHRDCEGCQLCLDAQGIAHTVQIYWGLTFSSAPSEAVQRFHRDFAKLEEEARAAEEKAAPAPVVVTKPPTPKESHPYWLS